MSRRTDTLQKIEALRALVAEATAAGDEDAAAALARDLASIEAKRRAGLARAASFTPAHQRAAQAARSSRSLAEAGTKGWAAAVAKHGERAIREKAAAWFASKAPSKPERAAMRLLDELGMAYRRGVVVDGMEVDLGGLPGALWLIEVNGKPHYDPMFARKTPGDRAAHDAAKIARLQAAGFRVLVLDDRQRRRWADQLRAFFGLGQPAAAPAQPLPAHLAA